MPIQPSRLDADITDRIRRRDVVKAAGATALGGLAVTGSVGGHESECVFFCGCGRMVAYGNLPVKTNETGGPANPIVVAKEGGGPGRPELGDHQGENDEDNNLEFTNRGRGKILALVIYDSDVQEVWFNPNQCAQNVFDEFEDESYRNKYLDTMAAHFGDKNAPWEEFTTRPGEKGHCHPPREHRHDHC